MPLTALDHDGHLLDSTVCGDKTWTSIHKPKVRVALACRDCQGSLHAKVSSTGLRFFAHDAKPENCASQGESVEHLTLKKTIAELIRGVGFEAVIEASPGAADSGGWRADVLGIGEDGRRVAFEVQLAGMTIVEGQERTGRYEVDGIASVWVSTKHARWMTSLPSAHVRVTDDEVMADRGLARLHGDTYWQPAGEVDFSKIVRGVLDGRIGFVPLHFFTEHVGDKTYYVDDPVVLASVRDIATYRERVQREEREDERRQLEEAKRIEHIKALYERQERVLQLALTKALEAGHESHRMWLGVPVTWWNGKLPVPLQEALGNEKPGRGGAIWTGPGASDVTLWGVVCPVANQVSPSLGASWKRRGVRVFVETEREAVRVANALGWDPQQLRVLVAVP